MSESTESYIKPLGYEQSKTDVVDEEDTGRIRALGSFKDYPDTKTEAVTELIDGRRSVYGEPTDTFARMAQMISGLLGHEVQPWQVPLILIITKMVRTNQCPTYSDNSDDIEGYLAIFRELIGEDMVHARSVDEYLGEVQRKKAQAAFDRTGL